MYYNRMYNHYNLFHWRLVPKNMDLQLQKYENIYKLRNTKLRKYRKIKLIQCQSYNNVSKFRSH